MHVISKDCVLVALTKSEIETITSALESDFFEWEIQKAGMLLSHFSDLKKSLDEEDRQILDDPE